MTARAASALAGCLIVIATGLAGCGSAAEPAGRDAPTTSAFPPPPVDPASAEGVAVEALRRIYTWRPAEEAPGAAMQRARPLLGPHLLDVLNRSSAELPKPDARWAEWAAARATVDAVAFASGEQAPDGTPDRTQCKVGIEQTVGYPDGHTETLPSAAIVATVVRTAQGWRLDDFS